MADKRSKLIRSELEKLGEKGIAGLKGAKGFCSKGLLRLRERKSLP